MPGRFIDTNVLVYLASGDAEKADRAHRVVADGGTINAQVLNELANVARRTMRLSWPETANLLETIRALLSVDDISLRTHEVGIGLAERHGFAMDDATIVGAALLARCDILWSEDMQHGMTVDDRLRILNPFRSR